MQLEFIPAICAHAVSNLCSFAGAQNLRNALQAAAAQFLRRLCLQIG